MNPRTLRPVHIPWGDGRQWHEAMIEEGVNTDVYLWRDGYLCYSSGITDHVRSGRLKWFPVAVDT